MHNFSTKIANTQCREARNHYSSLSANASYGCCYLKQHKNSTDCDCQVQMQHFIPGYQFGSVL